MDAIVESHAAEREGPWTLPPGWRWAKLSNVVDRVLTTDPKKAFGEGVFNYIDLSAIQDGRIAKPQTLTGVDAPSRARQITRSGDTVFSCVRVYLQNIALVEKGLTSPIASTAFCVLRPSSLVDARYLNYFVRSRHFIEWLIPMQRGNSPPAVVDSDIKAQPIPLAPLVEQKRIVARVDALFAEIAEGEAALVEARKGLDTFRRALLKAAVTGELTKDWREKNPVAETGHDLLARIRAERAERGLVSGRGRRGAEATRPDTHALPKLPDGWAWARPIEIESCVRNALTIGPFGSNLKVSDYRDSGVPLIFVRHIRSQNFGADNPKFITPAKAAELASHCARAGDILVTKMGDPPGDACRYPDGAPDAIITADCIKWTLDDSIGFKDFYVHFINSAAGRAQILEKTTGVAQQKVSLDRFRQILVPIPPPAEAAEILRRVSEALSAADETRAMLDAEAADATRLKQSILKAAFEGRLVPQSPADEPANVSLAHMIQDSPQELRGKTTKKRKAQKQ